MGTSCTVRDSIYGDWNCRFAHNEGHLGPRPWQRTWLQQLVGGSSSGLQRQPARQLSPGIELGSYSNDRNVWDFESSKHEALVPLGNLVSQLIVIFGH